MSPGSHKAHVAFESKQPDSRSCSLVTAEVLVSDIASLPAQSPVFPVLQKSSEAEITVPKFPGRSVAGAGIEPTPA